MSTALALLFIAPLFAFAAPTTAKVAPYKEAHHFDEDQEGAPPSGFDLGRTGTGANGKWVVQKDPDAPSPPQILAQLDGDRGMDRVLLAVVRERSPKDFTARVRCKMIAGKVDQSCGLVFRFVDDANYLLAVADALNGHIRLVRVKNGVQKPIVSFPGAVTGGVWHELEVTAKNDLFEVGWDGERVLQGRDPTFGAAGRIGVATQADSVTYFDDLSITGN